MNTETAEAFDKLTTAIAQERASHDALVEELKNENRKLAARIRELEGALRALLSITRPGPHDRNAKDEPHVELCRRWNDARRVLGGAA